MKSVSGGQRSYPDGDVKGEKGPAPTDSPTASDTPSDGGGVPGEASPPLSTIWVYDHPRRGSCVKGCPSYGRCHCGCGGATTWNAKTDRSKFLVKDQPCVYKSGHAGSMARNPAGAIVPICGHPGDTHKARGMCKHCYDNWFKKNSRHAKKYHTKISPQRREWERKRHNRFLSLLWKYDYSQITLVLEKLDREVPPLPEEGAVA